MSKIVQSFSEIIDNWEKQCCSGSHKQCKTIFKDHLIQNNFIMYL